MPMEEGILQRARLVLPTAQLKAHSMLVLASPGAHAGSPCSQPKAVDAQVPFQTQVAQENFPITSQATSSE